MKKTFIGVLTIVLMIFVVSCSNSASSSIVVSKLYDATEQSNNIIELYNNSDSDEDLSKYSINFYRNDSPDPTNNIELSGTILAHSYFVITGSNSTDSTITSKADFVYSEGNLPYNGNDAIELLKRGKTVDLLGYIGMDVPYSLDVTLIRLGNVEDFTPSATYNEFNFITYIPDVFKYLKNDDYQIKTLDDLYAGPKLEERYLNAPYVDANNSNLGGGGAVSTIVTSIADGDTAYFAAMNGFPGGSMRYYYINTPEVDSNYVNAEPWGYVASMYNKKYLLSDPENKEILVQSIPGYSLYETNGRNLGLVWIDGNLSQFLIVSEGLTEDVGFTYDKYDLALTYKDVPYLTFLRFAEERARENGWGLHGYPTLEDGEKSPDWNYISNKNSTHDPVWEPHLTLPWE